MDEEVVGKIPRKIVAPPGPERWTRVGRPAAVGEVGAKPRPRGLAARHASCMRAYVRTTLALSLQPGRRHRPVLPINTNETHSFVSAYHN